MALDSSAVFQQRLVQLGLDAFKVQFTNEGWTTMGEFAFSAAFSPGNADETVFNTQVVAKILGDAGHVKRVAVKRLFYESYTMMVSEMKHKVERTDGEPPRKLPAPEREARRLSQQEKLSGLEIKGPLECSDALVDKAVAMYDENLLRYVPWEACTDREAELQGLKTIKEYKPDNNGFMREHLRHDEPSASVSSDLLLKMALTRRGLALDQALVMSFKMHEKIVNLFFGEMMRAPPPGYSRVSVNQVLRADIEIFKKLQELTRSGVQATGAGVRPVDDHVVRVIESAAVQLLLLPLKGGSTSSGSGGGGNNGDGPSKARQRREKQKNARANDNDNSKKRRVEPVYSGGKDWGKGSGGKGVPLPKELLGCTPVADGKYLCFGYNLREGCPHKDVEPGNRCRKGFHLCMVKGCGREHPAHRHQD